MCTPRVICVQKTRNKKQDRVIPIARVAELVYARGLGPRGAILGGSSPLSRTQKETEKGAVRRPFLFDL